MPWHGQLGRTFFVLLAIMLKLSRGHYMCLQLVL